MKTRYFIIAAIIFLAGLSLLLCHCFLLDQWMERAKDGEIQFIVSEQPSDNVRAIRRRRAKARRVQLRKRQAESPEGKALVFDAVLTGSSKEEMRQVFTWLNNQGVFSIRAIPELNTLLIRNADEELLAAIHDNFPNISQERDFEISRPSTPSPNTVAVGRPFRNDLLDWLGIDSNQQGRGRGVTIAVLDEPVSKTASTANANLRQLDIHDLADSGQNEGHGNAVTSILAAGTEGLKGIVPSATILSIPVLDNSGSGSLSAVAQGIVTAVDNGADIISLSLGSESPSRLLQSAIDYAHERGVVIVAAAGNDGIDAPYYPAACNHVIAVAACDASSNAMAFSNYGDAIDIAAPGVSIAADFGNESPEPFSGTSAAAPCVAGVIAAILSENIGKMTPSEAAETVLSYAYDHGAPGQDEQFGNGVLNYARAANSSNPNYTDAAAAGHFLDLDNASPADTPLLISAQNTGNTTLPSLTLQYWLEETAYARTFENVAPGETVTATVAVPNTLLEGFIVTSIIKTPATEATTENNSKTSRIKVKTEEQSEP